MENTMNALQEVQHILTMTRTHDSRVDSQIRDIQSKVERLIEHLEDIEQDIV